MIALLLRTDRSALVALWTPPPLPFFAPAEMAHITQEMLDSPGQVLSLSRIHPIPAGFDL